MELTRQHGDGKRYELKGAKKGKQECHIYVYVRAYYITKWWLGQKFDFYFCDWFLLAVPSVLPRVKKGALESSGHGKIDTSKHQLMRSCALSVVSSTLLWYCPHHAFSGTLQGRQSDRFIASRRVRKGTRRVLHPSQQPRENTGCAVTRI